jgi:hypothetical protein
VRRRERVEENRQIGHCGGKPERVEEIRQIGHCEWRETKKTMTIEFHPLANVFPLMSDDELGELAADIAANGQSQPIYLYEGMILDGRNRYLACLRGKVKPWFRPWDGEGDPADFVVSMNLRRRFLDGTQRAVAAAKLASLRQGRPAGPGAIGTTDKERGDENRQIGPFDSPRGRGVAMPEAAGRLNVSERTVRYARKVLNHAAAAVVAAVDAGRVSVSDAAKVADQPSEVQEAALRAVSAGEARTLVAAVKKLRRRALAANAPPPAQAVAPNDHALREARAQFASVGRKLDDALVEVERLCEFDAGYYLRKQLDNLRGKIREMQCILARSAP